MCRFALFLMAAFGGGVVACATGEVGGPVGPPGPAGPPGSVGAPGTPGQSTGASAGASEPGLEALETVNASGRSVNVSLRTLEECSAAGMRNDESCAADNAKRWQLAFDHARKGAELLLPPGIFPINPVRITQDGVTVRGAGLRVTVLKDIRSGGDSSDTIDIRAPGGSDPITVQLSGFAIEGDPSGRGIGLKDTRETSLESIRVQGAKAGVHVRENNTGLHLAQIRVEMPSEGGIILGSDYVEPPEGNPTIVDTYLTEIAVSGLVESSYASATRCEHGIVIRSGVAGVYGDRVSVQRCKKGFATTLYPRSTHSPERVFCSQCMVDASDGDGWFIEAAHGLFLSNSWSSSGGGVGVQLLGGKGITLQAMHIYNNQYAGISAADVEDLIVNGSHIAQNNSSGQCASGIYLAPSVRGASIVGNLIDNKGTGTAEARPLKCHIELRAGLRNDYSITGNQMDQAQPLLDCEPQADYRSVCPFDRVY